MVSRYRPSIFKRTVVCTFIIKRFNKTSVTTKTLFNSSVLLFVPYTFLESTRSSERSGFDPVDEHVLKYQVVIGQNTMYP